MLRPLLLIVGALICIVLGFGTGLVIGLVVGERGAYHRRYQEERKLITPVIASETAFEQIEVEERSDGGIYLIGEVSNAAALKQLRELVVRVLGETRANEVMSAVDVSHEND